MKVPAWEFWSTETSWGMRELDTRKLREGASIEEAYSDTAHHIDMGWPVSKSGSNDAKFMGEFLKDWAWNVGIGLLLDDYHELAYRLNVIETAAKNKIPIVHVDP